MKSEIKVNYFKKYFCDYIIKLYNYWVNFSTCKFSIEFYLYQLY